MSKRHDDEQSFRTDEQAPTRVPLAKPTSSAVRLTMTHENDIPIGDGNVISWIPVDHSDGLVEIDHLLPVADWFWGGIEVHCVAGCCGAQAFDFTAHRIRWVLGDDIDPPAYSTWRPPERGDPLELADRFDQTIRSVEALDATALVSNKLNQFFDPRMFVELLTHIAAALRTPRG